MRAPVKLSIVAPILVLLVAAEIGCLAEATSAGSRPPVARSMPLRVARAPDVSGGGLALPSLDRFPSELLLPWGGGEGQVGLIPYREERPPIGPSSVAVSPTGSVWVLDQVNRRVVQLSPDGRWLEAWPCPPGAADLAVDPSGRPAVLSLVNHRVTFVDADGSVDVAPTPLALRVVDGIAFEADGALVLETGYQETWTVGRSGAWASWPELVRTKREGVRGGGDGPLRQVMLREGRAVLLDAESDERMPAETPLEGTGGVASVALVASLADRGAIVVLEWFADDAVLRTLRRVDARGRTVAEVDLPRSPLYFPPREFAVGGDGTVVHLYPTDEGLHLRRVGLTGGEGER